MQPVTSFWKWVDDTDPTFLEASIRLKVLDSFTWAWFIKACEHVASIYASTNDEVWKVPKFRADIKWAATEWSKIAQHLRDRVENGPRLEVVK